MKYLIFAALLSPMFALAEEATLPEATWFYRGAGLAVTLNESMGKAGDVVVYTLSTSDKVEDVIKWYGNRLSMKRGHSLIAAAESGFSSLDEAGLHGTWQHINDADQEKNATLIIADIDPQHSHVNFYHRLKFDSLQAVSISISQTAKGTSIIVVYPQQTTDRTTKS